MSRFREYDGDGDYLDILAQGRWEWNARQALRGKRGRAALQFLREALMALPEHKLIDRAMCTAGSLDKRMPEFTGADRAAYIAQCIANGADPERAEMYADAEAQGREAEREDLASLIEAQGGGVCAIGAYRWYQLVKNGMDPEAAFDELPTLLDTSEDADPGADTADVGVQAGLTYTLAYELAWRNDDIYGRMTPEQRWQAYMDWIDAELAKVPA